MSHTSIQQQGILVRPRLLALLCLEKFDSKISLPVKILSLLRTTRGLVAASTLFAGPKSSSSYSSLLFSGHFKANFMGRRRQQSPPGGERGGGAAGENLDDLLIMQEQEQLQQQQQKRGIATAGGAGGGKKKGATKIENNNAVAAAATNTTTATRPMSSKAGGGGQPSVALSSLPSNFTSVLRTGMNPIQVVEELAGGDSVIEIVVVNGAGSRLDSFLADCLKETPRARISRWIVDGGCSINGKVIVKRSYTVKRNEVIRLAMKAPPPSTIEPENIPLSIVFEDDYLIVVNKSPGMVVHPAPGLWSGTLVNALLYHFGCSSINVSEFKGMGGGGGEDGEEGGAGENGEVDEDGDGEEEDIEGVNEDNIVAAIDKKLAQTSLAATATSSSTNQFFSTSSTSPPSSPRSAAAANNKPPSAIPSGGISLQMRPGIAHRIDKDTSGLLVVAKDSDTLVGLQVQFAAHTVQRTYNAIVWGQLDNEGRVDTHLARDPANRLKMAVCNVHKGKRAITDFAVLDRFRDTCIAQFKLHTGRTHQIRVHAKHIGHTLLSDDVYGGRRILQGTQSASRREFYTKIFEAIPRQALHAKTLGFIHPKTKQKLFFESDLPADFVNAIRLLREDAK